MSEIKDALDQLAKDSEHFEESNKKTTQSMMDMFAQSELLGKIADSGRKVLDSLMNCVDASAQFETSLAKLSTIADTGSVSLNTLSSDLLTLSNDTGVAATSLTESAYQAISASVDTASAVDFVAQANELAVGGFTSTETAVDVLSTAINAYGLEVSQAGQLSDYLITTQNLGKTSVDELAQSVGKVIPLASAYNVEMDNLSAAYAVLTANGIATAETGTYLKSMFTELADTGSDVAKTLQDETGMSFSELSASGSSLGDVLAIIGASVDNDATAFSNLWSSSEAGVGALSLLNAGTEKYNSVLNEMQNSTGAASKAYESMTNTAEFAEQRMTNSANNLKIAIGDSLLDTFTSLNNVLADGLNWLTEFAQEHETLVAGLTSGVAVAALLVVGLAGLGMAITAVTAATAALNLTTGGLLLAIGSIATAVGFLVSAFASGDDAVEDYDGTLSECRTEIEQTELALVKAIDRYGENSDAVQDLESKLDTLNKQYEAGGGAIAEYAETAGNAAKKLDELQKSENDAMTALDKTNVSGLTAVSMLESLSGKADITNADLDMMSGYADYLNDTFSCNIEVNYDTGELTGFDPGVIVKQIQDSYNEKKQTIAFDTISDVDFVDSYKAQYESLKSAKAELKALETELANISMTSAWGTVSKDGYSQSHVNDLIDQIGALKGSVSELETGMASYDAELQKNCDILDESGSLYEDMVNSLNGGTNSIEKYGEAVNDTMTEQEAWDEKLLNCQEELDNLCIAYDEAREAALKSIQDQYNAWDTVEEVSTMSVSSIQEALQSQTSYWTEYNDNLAGLQERASGIEGLSDMLTDVADGSENSAAMLAGLAGASDAELQTVVDNWLALQQQENDTADTMGDVASQFSVKTGEMISDMQNMVNGMDLSGDAAAAASTTTNAFFDTMEGVINARSGAITASLASIMHSANMSVPVRKHAKGTTDAENVFIAGENGAELIVGMGGSTVFPASETQKIINAVTDYADFSGNYTPQNTSSYSNTVTTFAPVFYLTLNGGMSQSNQKQAKRWMQQVTEDLFASIGRTNPAIYVI